MRARRLAALACLTAALALAAAPASGARPDDRARVGVATYNVYLGADLNPLFGATTLPQLVARAGGVYAAMEATDFPERAEAIADAIVAEQPDVVGLQEVAHWATAPGTLLAPTAPFTTTYDFLDLLLDELAERGVPYREVATNANFTGTLPISLGAGGTATWASFTDRDVVVVRDDVPARHLAVDEASVQEETFAAVLTIPSGVPGLPPFAVPRGWSFVDVTAKGFTFRFVNTHLEAFSEAARNAQAGELAAEVAASPHPVVLVGDINSRPPGCSTNTVAFQTLLDTGLVEVWPLAHPKDPCGGFTSGQDADLLNEASTLDHRIDTVFVDPDALTALGAEVIGDEQADRSQPTGLWPSDHAGSVATLRTVRP
ncbi:MAG: endonuclease/exonuclease/phosphatase family protein [Actinomycetes bacterium]